VGRSGHEISGEKERSVGQNVVDEDENEEVEDDEQEVEGGGGSRGGWHGRVGRLRNLAQLRAGRLDTTHGRASDQAFLIANTRSPGEFPVHPRVCIPFRPTSPAPLLPSSPRPPPPFIAWNLGFPFVVFPPLARPFADWRRISNNL